MAIVEIDSLDFPVSSFYEVSRRSSCATATKRVVVCSVVESPKVIDRALIEGYKPCGFCFASSVM